MDTRDAESLMKLSFNFDSCQKVRTYWATLALVCLNTPFGTSETIISGKEKNISGKESQDKILCVLMFLFQFC